MISGALIALAEDPDFFVDPPEDSQCIADDRFCVVIGPRRRWAGVCRLRLPAERAALAEAVEEIRRIVEGIDSVVLKVGSCAAPQGLPERLRALGLRDPDPPLDAVVAAMALEEEPPRVDGVDVRRIETFDDHLAGLEIMLASASWTDAAAAKEREGCRDVRAAQPPRRPSVACAARGCLLRRRTLSEGRSGWPSAAATSGS